MMDIERISKKIREEKDNLIAKAFTCQISNLLLTNGIVPIMTEYRKNDLESITDTDRYKLVYELGVTFDSLDTTEHDKKIREEVIDELFNIRCDEVSNKECDDYEGRCSQCKLERLQKRAKQLKEQNKC